MADMKKLIIAALPLALAACGQKEATNEVLQADEITFENEEEAGDVTAIDAATNNDAGMAPDSAPRREQARSAPAPRASEPSEPTEPTPMDEAIEDGAETEVES